MAKPNLETGVAGDAPTTAIPSYLLGWNGTQWVPVATATGGALTLDTELPAAVALSDTMANPTAPPVGACELGWDTSAAVWVRRRASYTHAIPIDTIGYATAYPGDIGGGNNPLEVLPFGVTGSMGSAMLRTPSVFKTVAAVAVTAGTPVAGWTPASGKKFRLMGYALSLSVAGAVIMKDATTELIRTALMLAGDGHESPPMGNGILSAAANQVLNLDVTATGTVSGFLFGTEE